MCLTGWAPERVLDTGGTNYPLIMQCWQSVQGMQTERGNATARAGREKLDSVSSLSRVFDGRLWHIEWCTRGSAAMTACALTIPFSIRCMFSVCHRVWEVIYPLEHTCSRVFLFMYGDVTQTTIFLFFLTDAWNSVAPWLHTVIGADVGVFWLETTLWDGCHPNSTQGWVEYEHS